jgi:hypothetical protein
MPVFILLFIESITIHTPFSHRPLMEDEPGRETVSA